MHYHYLIVSLLFISCTRADHAYDAFEDSELTTEYNRPYVEATSMSGEGLVRPEFDEETNIRLTNNLREAINRFSTSPNDPESIIWVARHTAYLWRFNDAIYILTDGITEFPDDPRFYRHRGHRFITIRAFDKAIDDLTKASQLIDGLDDIIEPDGAPNTSNIPVTTLHYNVYYHLGLAYYLNRDFDAAVNVFRKALQVSQNSDSEISATDWLYMSLMRAGQVSQAQFLLSITDTSVDVIESESYLNRLRLYKNEISPEELLSGNNDLDIITQGYGLAQYYLFAGDTDTYREILNKVIDTNYWAAFGYIAAEVDLFYDTHLIPTQ
jgi:tetratricopeptide (TPR) repeat protein